MNHFKKVSVFGFPIRGCYEKLGFDMDTEKKWDDISMEFHGEYAKIFAGTKPYPEIIKLLKLFKNAGIEMSVLSASEAGILVRQVEGYGIRTFFKHVVGISDYYGGSKMKQGKLLIEKIGLPTERVLFIGDTTHDYEVAQKMGVECLLLACGHQTRVRIEQCNCEIVENLSALLNKAETELITIDPEMQK